MRAFLSRGARQFTAAITTTCWEQTLIAVRGSFARWGRAISAGLGALPERLDEQQGGPRLEASLILFASEECSDRARSFRNGKAERCLRRMQVLHSSTLCAAAVHATRVGGWQKLTASVPSPNPSAAVAIAG